MATGTEDIGHRAVEIATQGETANSGKMKYGFDLGEFGKFVGIWILTAAILFSSLLIITLVKGSEDVLRDTIKEVDTINMTFSLVLSALLEQIWSKETNKGIIYSITLGTEGFLAIVGGMLYVAYSIMKIVAPDNKLIGMAFHLNLGYIIVSMVVVLIGFWSRSIHVK